MDSYTTVRVRLSNVPSDNFVEKFHYEIQKNFVSELQVASGIYRGEFNIVVDLFTDEDSLFNSGLGLLKTVSDFFIEREYHMTEYLTGISMEYCED